MTMTMAMAMAMAMDGPKSPKKATLALAELDSVLSGATTSNNQPWVDSDEMASTDDTPKQGFPSVAIKAPLSSTATKTIKPRASSLPPHQRDTQSILDNGMNAHYKAKKRSHFAGDDVSTCSNTIVSRDVSRDGSVFSMPELLSNVELMNDVVHHLTRPVTVSNHPGNSNCMDHTTPADRFLMEITKDAMAKESTSASVRSSNSVAMSHASKSSMASRRSSRRRRKRGASLERDISICILQSAAGGSDMAHFLVISQESTEVILSTDAILEDLRVSNPSVGETSVRPQRATRGIQFGNIPTLEDNRIHSIEYIENKKSLSATASIFSDYERTKSDPHFTIPLRDASSVTIATSKLQPMESMQQLKKLSHGAGEEDFSVRTPSATPLNVPKGNWTSFEIVTSTNLEHNITEFDYHDTNDTCWSVTSPSTEGGPKGMSASTGSVVMDLLGDGSDDDNNEPGRNVVPRNILQDDHECGSTLIVFQDIFNDNETSTRDKEQKDDIEASSHTSEKYSPILSLSEHAAISYSLTSTKSSHDVKVHTPSSHKHAAQIQSVSSHDMVRLKPSYPSEIAKSDGDEISVHPIFESSKNGFGGVYAFDMDEDDDWTMFDVSVSESPSRKTKDSSADSGMFNIVHTDPEDFIKKMVAQPDSPTSVVNIIGNRRVEN